MHILQCIHTHIHIISFCAVLSTRTRARALSRRSDTEKTRSGCLWCPPTPTPSRLLNRGASAPSTYAARRRYCHPLPTSFRRTWRSCAVSIARTTSHTYRARPACWPTAPCSDYCYARRRPILLFVLFQQQQQQQHTGERLVRLDREGAAQQHTHTSGRPCTTGACCSPLSLTLTHKHDPFAFYHHVPLTRATRIADEQERGCEA